jgi:PAS domain S-box-containing protein
MIHKEEELRSKAARLEKLQSEHERMKKRFKEMEARYRALFDRSIYCIYLHDLEGRFLDANDAALHLLGYTRKEILSQDLVSVLGETQAREAYARLPEILKEGSSRKAREYILRTKNGSTVWVEVDVSLIYQEGRPYAIQGVAKDITLSKKGELALREGEKRYRTLFEQSADAVYMTSREGTFLDANPALVALFGYTQEELLAGFNVRQLYCNPKDRDAFQKKVEERGFVRNYPITFRGKDGTKIDCLLTSSVRRSEDGTVQGYQGIIRDVTEQKKAEKALQESTERLKFFAYSVSHDLKSPAIGAYGFAKRLSERYRDSLDETGRHYCDQIAAASEQIAVLVDQINLFMAAKEVPLNLEAVDVKEILQRIREDFSPQLQVRQIDWQEPDQIPSLNADRLSLSRILRNLVDNALKYGGTDLSHIRIGYREKEDHHLFFVEDNGAGIKGEDAQKIFGVFMRRKNSKGVQGTGLGLAIVKEMAERHGGRAWVEPGSKGGSVFYVSISKALPLGYGQ